MAQRSNGKTTALWVLSGLLAALYLFSGGSKLAGAEQHIQAFARWGWPDWMRLAVGAVEVGSAILLLVPRLAHFGAGAMMVVMAGATYTHLFRATGEGAMAVLTLVLLALCAVVFRARWPASVSGVAPGTAEEAG
jgi:putative oxidoreductase